MDSKFVKFLTAAGYKMRCKTKCGDMFPVYGDCMCSSCTKNRKEPSRSQQVDSCIAESQSGETVLNTTTDSTEHQNVSFSDEVTANLLMLDDDNYDHTFDDSFQEQAALGEFLSRPVRIFSYTWNVGNATPDFFGINPWVLYFQQTSILQKISRFKLFHGTLNLKIVINGAPFHYGRYFVGVRPTQYDNNTLSIGPSSVITMGNMRDASALKGWYPLRALYSQRKHVFLDPSTNQPAEISWPFICATNYLDLQDPETFDRMGLLEWWELNILRHANGETDPVRITVFAHFTDVSLTGLTYNEAEPVAQAGAKKKVHKKSNPKPHSVKKVKNATSAPRNTNAPEKEANTGSHIQQTKGPKPDEYGKGPVSGVATSVSKAASYFTNVPLIGPFARATEIGAGAISSVAKLFGFSRPSDLEDFCQTRNLPLGRMAVTVGQDPIVKLSLDPKQELCVDPTTVGLANIDEMSFLHIAKQETLINQFPWTITGTGSTGTLCMLPVNPWNQPIFTTQSQTVYAQTSLSFVCRPFSFWTGSLRYRFQIVASQFHRGRLLIQYEPHINTNFVTQAATILADGDGMNARYSHILDLSEERDITFEINWAQHEAWRYILTNGTAADQILSVDGDFDFSSLPATTLQTYNGVVRVFVINNLTAPDDSSNVEVNVFISAGDSFQVCAPSEAISTLAYARNGVTVGPPAWEPPEAQSGERIKSAFRRIRKTGISQTYICIFLILLQLFVNNLSSSLNALHLDLRPRFNYASIADYLEANGPVPIAHAGDATFTTTNENAPNQPTQYVLNGEYRMVDVDANSVYMGEVVASIRSLIKRYNYHRSISFNDPAESNGTVRGVYYFTFTQRDFPNGPGNYAGNEGSGITYAVVNPGPASQPYNICVMTYLRYFAQAFVGYRGGVRWKAICYRSERLQHWPVQVQRRRVGPIAEIASNTIIGPNSSPFVDTFRQSSYAQIMINDALTNVRSMAGIHATVTGVNPVLEYELPYYAQYRYGELHEPNPTGGSVPVLYQSLRQHGHTLATFGNPIWPQTPSGSTNNIPQDIQFDMYVAASEDFAYYIFIGAPPILVSDAGSVSPGSAP